MPGITPEGRIKKAGRIICENLELYGFPVNQGGYGRTGIPDDCYCARGQFVFIEYKAHVEWRSRTKSALATLPTMRQCMEMEKARKSGAITLVVDDVGLARLASDLMDIMRGVQYLYNAWLWKAEEYSLYRDGRGSLRFYTKHRHPEFSIV